MLELDVNDFKGGVALWGAIPPLYDTTSLPLERGVHVHARKTENGNKEIDNSYPVVFLNFEDHRFKITELDAIYFMVSSVFKKEMKYLECPDCKVPHLDRDWFSIHPHKRHLCSGCGKYFSDSEFGIGNPICEQRDALTCAPRKAPSQSQKRLEIRQSDYPGGIQIWGSNPAILWTREQSEESGIHVHLYSEDGSNRTVDDTFGRVIIDNVEIHPNMVRVLMAQTCLPHIKSRLLSLECQECGEVYFDTGDSAFSPVGFRECYECFSVIRSGTRLKKVISNPLLSVFSELENKAVRQRQIHDLELVPETI